MCTCYLFMPIISDIQGILWAKICNTISEYPVVCDQSPLPAVWRLPLRRKSRLLKNLHQKSYIFNVKVFPFPKITMTFWSKVLVCIIHPNYVFLKSILRSKEGLLYTTVFSIWKITVLCRCLTLFLVVYIFVLFFNIRHFNEMAKHQDPTHSTRPRTVSSPIPYASPNTSRPLSPGM